MLGVVSKGEATLSRLMQNRHVMNQRRRLAIYEFTSSNGELDPRSPNGPFCRESLPYPLSNFRRESRSLQAGDGHNSRRTFRTVGRQYCCAPEDNLSDCSA